MRARLPHPALITIDLDGTLLDEGVWLPTVRRTCDRLQSELGLDADRLLASNRVTWSTYWPTVEEAWTLGRLSGADLTVEAWRRTLADAGHDPSLAKHAAHVYLEQRVKALRLYPDVRRALASLPGRRT